MEKEKKYQSNRNGNGNRESKGRDHLPGAPAVSNRQTGGNKRRERDESSGAEKNTTKKGSNNI
jgi:hypothetical protein